jgi:oxygen-dependent protoporphyrinogen oxidase
MGPPVRSQVDAGMDKSLVFGDPTAPRFVYWEKKLRATPSGLDAVTFDLLSPLGKIRAGLGAIGLIKDGPPPGERIGFFQAQEMR